MSLRKWVLVLLLLAAGWRFAAAQVPNPAATSGLEWPRITKEMRPWAYWWWLGSAVDPANLAREMQRYKEGGMGGFHIIPILRRTGL